MGVKGLWQILEPVGKPVTLESLEGKVLAIDVSLWIHQAVKGAGSTGTRNPHLVTLFHRLVKLLFYKTKPVFVFDGLEIPHYKRRTLNRRKLKRKVASMQLNKIQRKILGKIAQEQLLKPDQYDAEGALHALQFGSKATADPMFDLPSETPQLEVSDASDDESAEEDYLFAQAAKATLDTSFASSTSDLDVKSEGFLALPIEVQRELLVEAQELKKDQRTAHREALPEDVQEFSDFQLGNLLKKNELNRRLNQVNKELCAKDNTVTVDWLHERYGQANGTLNIKKIIHENLREKQILFSSQDEVPQLVKSSSDTLSGSSIQNLRKRLERQISPIKNGDTWKTEDDDFTPEIEAKVAQEQKSFPEEKLICSDDKFDVVSCDEPKTEDIKFKAPTSASSCIQDNLNLFSPAADDYCQEEEGTKDENQTTAQNETEAEISTNMISTDKMPDANTCLRKDDEKITPAKVEFEDFSSDDDDLVEVLEEEEEEQPTTSSNYTRLEPITETFELLEKQRKAADGAEKSMTEQIYEDCQKLLQLFGVPFLVAPGEAEAQCAWLESAGLVSATVTEDSDTWLFGSRKVYRNVFNRDKHPQFYSMEDVRNCLGLSREKLVLIAILTGCDYTDGVESIGVVAAMEILAEFREAEDLRILQAFHDWWDRAQRRELQAGEVTSTRLKLSRLPCVFPPSFPDSGVWDAFLKPNVDHSTEKFAWGLPNIDEVRAFLSAKVGMAAAKIDELLLPVVQKIKGNTGQTHISNFMVRLVKDPSQMKVSNSKRVELAVQKLKTTSPAKAETSSPTKAETTFPPKSSVAPKNVEQIAKKRKLGKRQPKVPRKSSKVKVPRENVGLRPKRASKSKAEQKIEELQISESSSSDD